MLVKIGSKIFNSEDEPIMLVLSPEERRHMRAMGVGKRYCGYPENMASEDAIKFMDEDVGTEDLKCDHDILNGRELGRYCDAYVGCDIYVD